MKTRLYLCFILTVFSNACAWAKQNTNPEQIIEGLRNQMKELETIKADYTVETKYGTSNTTIQCKVSYLRDRDKYNILERMSDSQGKRKETRTIYNGFELKAYIYDERNKIPRQGGIFPANQHEMHARHNDILRLANFSMVSAGMDEKFPGFTHKNIGSEAVNGQDCAKVLYIAPYKAGHDAYIYNWIELAESQYILRKVACLIDNDPQKLLYERKYKYNPSDKYPFPKEIYYERYEVDDNGGRRLYYKKKAEVENIQVNISTDASKFEFMFPKNTLVNVSPEIIVLDKPDDPNKSIAPEKVKPVVKTQEAEVKQKIEFTIAKAGDPILVPVRFRGEEYLFVVDTGSSHTTFDSSFKNELGDAKKMVMGETLANSIVVQTFDAPEAFLGPFGIQDCGEVICMDLRMLSLVDGKKISGIIGMNFLKNYVVQIDFDNGRLSFSKPMGKRGSALGKEFAINDNTLGMPQIKGNILDGIKVDFIIDTGLNATGTLERKISRAVLSKRNLKTSDTLVATLSGTVRSRDIRIDSISFGSFQYRDLIFGEGSVNNLGLDFLSRHLVTFDFPNNRIYLKKGKGFEKTEEADMSGLHLLNVLNKVIVYSIDESSPAQKAGIKTGDIILKVGDKDANTYDMWELRRLLRSGDKQKITMTIKSGDGIKDVSFLLKKKI